MTQLAKHGGWRVLAKYLLFQVPGWVGIAVILNLAMRWSDLSREAAIGLFVLWLIKDAVLYPFVRRAYGPSEAIPGEAMLGARGVVTRTLAPEGYVRVGSEHWMASIREESPALSEGTFVRVLAVRDLRLLVEAEAPSGDAPEG